MSYADFYRPKPEKLKESLRLQNLATNFPEMIHIDKGFIPRTKTDFLVLWKLRKTDAGRKKLKELYSV